jgi:hypothetical protein
VQVPAVNQTWHLGKEMLCFCVGNTLKYDHICCCFPMPPYVRHGLRGLPPGCGWSATNFWGWDAHEARSCCPNEVDGDIWIWSTRRGALSLNSTTYPDHGHHGDPPLSGKNPHGRAGNQTWDLMISSQKHWPLDHEAGHMTIYLVWQ